MKTETIDKFKGLLAQSEEIARANEWERIGRYYSKIADRYFEAVSGSTIKENLGDYKVICSPMVIFMAYMNKEQILSKAKGRNLDKFMESITTMAKAVSEVIGNTKDVTIIHEKLTEALDSLEAGDIVDDGDLIEDKDIEDAFRELADDYVEGDKDGGAEDLDKAFENIEDSEGIKKVTEVRSEDSIPTNKDKRNELEMVYGGEVTEAINVLMKTLNTVYKSGYEGMKQPGILVLPGNGTGAICRALTDGGITTVRDKYVSIDVKVANAIASAIPEVMTFLDSEVSDCVDTMMQNRAIVCRRFHLQVQSANIKFCTGDMSIRKWVTETRIGDKYKDADEWLRESNKSTTSLTKFSDVASWIRWSVENIIYNSLIRMGITASNSDMNKASNVISAITSSLKNVAVVADRENGVATEIRISSYKYIDVDRLTAIVSRVLGNRNITTRVNSGVTDMRIVFDEEKDGRSNKFAYEIMDNVLQSDNPPSWSHALLGKTEDGSYLFWDDFMNPSNESPYKRCYTIYAASRSGKGIMTSTLLASALCDGKQVFYTDGKPENGATLGMIAWSKGKEAYAFDGKAVGDAPFIGNFEDWTNGVRSYADTTAHLKDLPKELFEESFSASEQLDFLGVMRYIRSMYLCARNINERTKGGNETPWQIWVFDEMTSMAKKEANIRKKFTSYLASRGLCTGKNIIKTALTVNDKLKEYLGGGDKADEGVIYIQNWLTWADKIASYMSEASVITLGKARLNLIFIFQEATWIREDDGVTTIGRVVASLKSTKIIGNNGMSYQCGEYGDGIAMNKDWAKKVNSGTGWWGISSVSNIAKDERVKVFKPYSVWTVKLDEYKNIDRSGFESEEESLKYFEGYTTKLLERYGKNPEDVLQEAYNYADEFVRNYGLGSGLLDYMYDTTNLIVNGGDNSLDRDLTSEKEESEWIGQYNSNDNSEKDKMLNIRVGGELEDEEEIDFDDISEPYGNNTSYFDNDSERHNYNSVEEGTVVKHECVDSNETKNRNATSVDTRKDRAIYYKNGVMAPISAKELGMIPVESACIDIVKPKGFNKIKARSFENKYGMSYEFKSRCDKIINGIKNEFGNVKLVNRLYAVDGILKVNDVEVDVVQVLDSRYGIRFEDVVLLDEFLKAFDMIKTVEIDSSIVEQMGAVHGVNWDKITLNKFGRLQTIKAQLNFGGQFIEINRNSLNSGVDAEKKKSDVATKLKVASAINKKDIKKEGAGYMNKVMGLSKRLGSSAVNNLTSKTKPSLGMAAINGVLATLVIGGGLLGGVFVGAGHLINRFGRS